MLNQVELGKEERFQRQLIERLHMIVTCTWLEATLLGREGRTLQLLLGLGDVCGTAGVYWLRLLSSFHLSRRLSCL